MTAHNSRPLWQILTMTILGLPLLYVASFGPASWISCRVPSEAAWMAFCTAYYPLGWTIMFGPEALSEPLRGYAEVGMHPDITLYFEGGEFAFNLIRRF